MHNYPLINHFVNDKDHTAHVTDQTLAFELTLENFVEALMNAIKYLTEDQLVIIRQSQNIDRHIAVASKNRSIVVYNHNIIFIGISGAGLT